MPSRAGVTIKILTRENLNFYPLMGPWLANRRVITDLGHVPFDDENKTWIVAIDQGQVVGFVAAITKINHIEYCSDFVEPSSRQLGIYTMLFAKRDSIFRGLQIRAMATHNSLQVYLQNGFFVTRKLKRYMEVKRAPM